MTENIDTKHHLNDLFRKKKHQPYVAKQFFKLGDQEDVVKGYRVPHSSGGALYISDKIPKGEKQIFILKCGDYIEEIKIGDWVVNDGKGNRRAYTDEKFQKKFIPF